MLASHVPQMAPDDGVIDAARRALGDALLDVKEHIGEITVTVARDRIADVLKALRDTSGLEYQQLMEIAGVDYPERPERFEVVYHLLSLTRNRRILTDYGFEGFPQRKDFPLTGHIELRYSEAEKRVVYEPVSLPQDFRTFDFLMPWEGPEYRLPGDEKATAEGAGAPSPAPAPNAPSTVNPKTPAETPKTTDSTTQTGGGAPADKQATRDARKPRAAKAASEVSKPSSVEAVKPKPRGRPRKGGGPA
jgi:NADH-quinone oxidoreductase subunit C